MLLTTSQSNDCPQRRWRHLLLLQQRPRRQSQKLQQQPNNCDLDKKRSQIRRRIHNRCCHLVSIQTTTKFSRVVMTAGAVLFLLLSLFSNSNLVVVMGQNFGTGSEGVAVQLPSVDDSPVSVEALNKARIQAELDHEEQSRKHTQNVVRLAATDQLHSDIVTNRTRAYLSCESGEMIVKINFTEPFRGVGYSDYDRSSPCKFYGDGGRYYELRLPLKGCGTKQEAPRIFLNNIIVRFHRSLELEEDEIKTIICRYPPPLAPPPPLIAAPILEAPPAPVPFIPAKLSEVELLLIVSALLFLTLLLLGIGIGYYCLKRRNIKVVRKIPQTPTYVPEIKIPRVSVSSTETSEYSDERRSILSETSMIHRDHFRYDNMGYVPEPKATHYDDYYLTNQDFVDHDVHTTKQNIIAPPLPVIQSQMMDDRYVTNASQTDLDEDIENRMLVAPKKPKLTTIITDDYYITPKTTTEIVDEITTQRLYVPPEKPLTTKYIDDTFLTPQEDNQIDEETTTMRAYGPPVITKHTVDDVYIHPEQDTEVIEHQTTQRIYKPKQPTVHTVDDHYIHPEYDTDITEEIVNQTRYGPRKPTITTQTEEDYLRDVYDIDEMIDDTTVVTERGVTTGPTTRTIQTGEDEYVTKSRDVEEYFDSTRHRPGPSRKPKLTVKNIDDFYVTNIVETETDEKIIKTGRSMPNLLLEIDYDTDEGDNDDNRKRTPSPVFKLKSSGFDVKVRTIPREPKEPTTTTTTITDTSTTITKLDAILRIIDNPPPTLPPPQKPQQPSTTTTTTTTTSATTTTEEVFIKDSLDRHFPPPTREKLRTVIWTDEVFRTLIIESTTIEEYTERIERHPTYGPMFEPPTWEIIFRLLSLPEVVNAAPVQPDPKTSPGSTNRYPLDTLRSYKSGISAHEARSVTEEDVSFSRHRFTASHFVPEPDYDRSDSPQSKPQPLSSAWSSKYLPDPKRYDSNRRDFQPLKPAFGGGPIRRPSQPSRHRIDPLDLHTTPTSSVFGPRRLANPYDPYTVASPSMRRRILEYGQYRPYSPDIDALSLEPSTTIGPGITVSSSSNVAGVHNQSAYHQAMSSSSSAQAQIRLRSSNLNDEEIKSTTETDIYDWKRYS